MSRWQDLINREAECHASINIAMVGKYIDLTDSISQLQSVGNAGIHHNGVKVNIHYTD